MTAEGGRKKEGTNPLPVEGCRGRVSCFCTIHAWARKVEPRVRLFPEPLPVHGNANHSHSHGYAAELRIKTDVTGVGYPCLKQLARAVHSKAEAGLRAEFIKENFMSTQQN